MSELFHFKKFSVSHSRSSMKIGVDAVLLGMWVRCNTTRILEVGTGCGVISLILAQRFKSTKILAIDIDESSIEEAKENVFNSPWSDQITVSKLKFPDDLCNTNKKFGLLVSNPPFFKSGVSIPQTPREIARHQFSLSVNSLLNRGGDILDSDGCISVIFSCEFLEEVELSAKQNCWDINRRCFIRDNAERPFKRVMMEFQKKGGSEQFEIEESELTLFHKGLPTEQYRQLGKDFYLKF